MSGRWAYHGHVKLEDRVRDLVREGRRFTNHDLMSWFECSQQTGWNIISALKKEGLIVEVDRQAADTSGRRRIVYAPAMQSHSDKGATLQAVWR